jgi:hypothetical protein
MTRYLQYEREGSMLEAQYNTYQWHFTIHRDAYAKYRRTGKWLRFSNYKDTKLIIHDTSYDILINILTLPLSFYITIHRSILLHTGWYWFSGGSSLEVIDDRLFQSFYHSVVLQWLFPSPVKYKPEQEMPHQETLLTHTC